MAENDLKVLVKAKELAVVKDGRLSRERLEKSYGAWKNHISHGNCFGLGREMDKIVRGILEKEEST